MVFSVTKTHFLRMKVHNSSKTDILILVSVVPAFIFGFNAILFGSRFFNEGRTFALGSLATLVSGLITWYIHATVAKKLRIRFEKEKDGRKHFIASMFVFAIMTFLIFSCICIIYHYTSFLNFKLDQETYFMAVGLGLTINLVATSFNQSTYSAEKWKDSVLETEKLRQEALQKQLENLNGQINPHFLFNGLNSLSSLITENPEQANEYVNEMSRVYRYLLQVNTVDLVMLSDEVKFIQSYFHLLKIRHGAGIDLDIQIADKAMCCMIPPLTLQLLVENAVKHNKVLKSQPLLIQINSFRDELLTIINNLQRKTLNVESNNVGLKNIAAKFKLHGLSDIVVEETRETFSVTIPLIPCKEDKSDGVPLKTLVY
jgi:sensor histidine kinase YesM